MLIVNIKSRIIFLQIKSVIIMNFLSLSLSPRFSSANFHHAISFRMIISLVFKTSSQEWRVEKECSRKVSATEVESVPFLSRCEMFWIHPRSLVYDASHFC